MGSIILEWNEEILILVHSSAIEQKDLILELQISTVIHFSHNGHRLSSVMDLAIPLKSDYHWNQMAPIILLWIGEMALTIL